MAAQQGCKGNGRLLLKKWGNSKNIHVDIHTQLSYCNQQDLRKDKHCEQIYEQQFFWYRYYVSAPDVGHRLSPLLLDVG